MKKIITAIIAIALLITGACAESIFPTLSANTGSEFTAISFGAVTGQTPAEINTLLDGSTQQVYTGVTADQYNDFGVALGNAGYRLTSQEELANGIELTITNMSFDLVITYTTDTNELTVTYPAGVTPEKAVPNLFAGYETIEFGDTITVHGYGSITIDEMTFDGNAAPLFHMGMGILGEYYFADNAEVYISGSFSNTTTGSVCYSDIMYCTMHYITDEHTYSYPMHYISMVNSDGSLYLGTDPNWSNTSMFDLVSGANYPFNLVPASVSSLETGDFACVFSNIPELVKTSDTGILAITFDIPGADQGYVVYVRY